MATENTESKINIPVERTDLVVFEDAMSTVKERFNSEMKRIHEEIDKLSSNLMRLYTESSTLHEEMTAANATIEKQSFLQGTQKSLSSSPLVTEEGEKKTLKLQFNVSQFDPSEITVKVKNDTLIVSASHEEKSDNGSMLRQYYRELKIPEGVDPASITSTLSQDGILTVQAILLQRAVTDGIKSPSKSSSFYLNRS